MKTQYRGILFIAMFVLAPAFTATAADDTKQNPADH
jgi:hypothetical protein